MGDGEGEGWEGGYYGGSAAQWLMLVAGAMGHSMPSDGHPRRPLECSRVPARRRDRALACGCPERTRGGVCERRTRAFRFGRVKSS